MFVGHYGVSYVAKAAAPHLDLGLLFLATQAPDLLWVVLNLLGVERTAVDPALADSAAPLTYYHPYSHSLPAVLAQSMVVGAAAQLSRSGAGQSAQAATALFGAVVRSHWALDLLVHRPDLPLWGDRRKVGFGLSRRPLVAYATEALLLVGGLGLYLRAAPQRLGRGKAVKMAAFGAVLLLFQGFTTLRSPAALTKGALTSMLVTYGAFAGVARWLSRA